MGRTGEPEGLEERSDGVVAQVRPEDAVHVPRLQLQGPWSRHVAPDIQHSLGHPAEGPLLVEQLAEAVGRPVDPERVGAPLEAAEASVRSASRLEVRAMAIGSK